MIEKKSYLDSIFFFCFFLPLCVLYYLACNHFFPDIPEIFNYTNKHDHDIYVSTTKHIQEGNILIGLNNDVGIALIYIGIRDFFLNFGISDFELIAFIFNIITLIFIYVYYMKICNKLNLKGITKFYFFLGFQFLYFTQLINKDLLTILLFLLILKSLIDKQYKSIIIFSILFFFVRIQLLIFGVLCVYLSFGNFKRRILIAYIGTSLLGGFTSVNGELISEESMGSGFSSLLISINQSFFYLGYLIFNPVRVLQFIVDIYMSFNIYTEGLIDIAKVLRLPLLIAMFWFFEPLYYSIKNFDKVNRTIVKNIFIIIISFLLTWLINPTVNARYVMLMIPFLIILGRFVQINKKTFS